MTKLYFALKLRPATPSAPCCFVVIMSDCLRAVRAFPIVYILLQTRYCVGGSPLNNKSAKNATKAEIAAKVNLHGA